MLETQVLKINILKGILKITFWGKEERQKVSEEKVNVKHFVTVLKWCPFPSSGIHVTAQGWEPGELCDRSEAQCIQVSRESWMITSFPKCRRRTGQGGIIMQFRGAVHCNNFFKIKAKIPSQSFSGHSFELQSTRRFWQQVRLLLQAPLLSVFRPLRPSFLVLMQQDTGCKWRRGLRGKVKSGWNGMKC